MVAIHIMSMSGTHYTLHACLKYDEICIEERRQDRDGLLAHNDAVQLDEIQEDLCRPLCLL